MPQNGHAGLAADATANTDSDSGASLDDKRPLHIVTTSHTALVSSLALQSPFMSKASPADPFTSKHEASSVISSDSANALFERKDGAKGDGIKRDVLEKVMAQSTASGSRNSTDETSSLASSNVTASPAANTSPSIITYRKSRRTASEGNFQSILDAATPKNKFNSKLYVDEFLPRTPYRYATIKRNTDFHQLFPSLDLTDRFLDDYACALSREILLQGRVYISENYVCFNLNLLGWVTNLVIRQEDIISFEKKSTAGLFPNGIAIETKDAKHYFASFSSRDATFDFMRTVWLHATGREIDLSTKRDSEDDTAPLLVSEELESPSKLQSYILSIDGDDEMAEKDGEYDLLMPADSPQLVKVRRFRSGVAYQNSGPDMHAPTRPDLDAIREPNETELCDEEIDAPLGVVYDLAFGTTTDFHRKFLRRHDASEISDYNSFEKGDNAKQSRQYLYRKALGYSIGPKSTMCEVNETLEHFDLKDHVSVVSRTITPDVPLGNSFAVMTRYVFSWGQNNTTRVNISFYIRWTGSSWIKSVIEKQSLATQITTTTDYITALRAEVEEQTEQVEAEAEEVETISPEAPVPASVVNEVEVERPPEPLILVLANQWVLGNAKKVVSVLLVVLGVILLLQLVILYQLNRAAPPTNPELWQWVQTKNGRMNQQQKVQYLLAEIGRLAET